MHKKGWVGGEVFRVDGAAFFLVACDPADGTAVDFEVGVDVLVVFVLVVPVNANTSSLSCCKATTSKFESRFLCPCELVYSGPLQTLLWKTLIVGFIC